MGQSGGGFGGSANNTARSSTRKDSFRGSFRSGSASSRSGESWGESDSESLSEAEEEHKHVVEMLRRQELDEAARKIKHKQGVRAVDALEAHWGAIVAQAVQQVLSSCGDHVLEAR